MYKGLKGQSNGYIGYIGIMIFVVILAAVVIPVTKTSINEATSNLSGSEVITFNSLSAFTLAVRDIVENSETVVNSSNPSQLFVKNTDYSISYGSESSYGTITWLQNYTSNYTNASANGDPLGTSLVNITYESKNATFTSQNHTIRIGVFNISTGSVEGSYVIKFNGNTVSNLTLPTAGTMAENTFTNISGSWFTANVRPQVTIETSPGVKVVLNYSSLIQNGGERANIGYTYTPTSAVKGTDATMLNLVVLFIIIGSLFVIIRGLGII